jgi:5-methyltetrahydrofolate--homocysteine methyltransferase
VATLAERLSERRILISDGAWGTRLQSMDLAPGECAELWNVTHPDRVREVAASYVQAGSDLILTNTFQGSPLALERHGLAERTAELNAAGARISLEAAAGTGVLVAASIGPSGMLLEPLGTLSLEQLEAAFQAQIRAVVGAGVRLLCVETMIAIEEACAAVRAGRAVARELGVELDVMATLSYEGTPAGFRTVMGVDIPAAVQALEQAGADVQGSNCGNGIEQMVPIAAEYRRHTGRPLLIQANAGLPRLSGGRTVFRQSPADMVRWVPELIAAGANIIGGCCGTGPEHIRAIREAVDRVR